MERPHTDFSVDYHIGGPGPQSVSIVTQVSEISDNSIPSLRGFQPEVPDTVRVETSCPYCVLSKFPTNGINEHNQMVGVLGHNVWSS